MTPAPTIDVVVPSYGRPDALLRCVDALRVQEVPARRVVVVVRDDDAPTREQVEALGPEVRCAVVGETGLLAALRCGVRVTEGDVVAFTDDDARPRPDWIRRLGAWFARPDVGAVGGRDAQVDVPADPAKVVGRMAPFGRLTGAHHVGVGAPTDVDVLKGVNFAVRADALVLPRPGLLRDTGSSAHYEVLACREVRRQGWRVVYDPAIVVDHDVAPRVGSARIGAGAGQDVVRAVACNRIVAATVLERGRLPVQLGYGLLVGTRESPGLARSALAAAAGERDVVARLPASLVGQLEGAWRVCTRSADAVDSCIDLRAAG